LSAFVVFAEDTTSQITIQDPSTQMTSIASLSYQPDSAVSNFDVKTAYDRMQELQGSVDSITNELEALDKQELSGSQIPT
jgi:hypothetical protein